jgi:hypothetical protein
MIAYSGLMLPDDPLEIRAEHIRAGDLATALSRIRRWNGASLVEFTVAEHCLHCVALAKRYRATADVQLGALLHDAHEAYLGDWVTPLKQHPVIAEIYGKWAAHLDAVICEALGARVLEAEERDIVKRIDLAARAAEVWSVFEEAVAAQLSGGRWRRPAYEDLPRLYGADHGWAEWLEALSALKLAALPLCGCERH